MHIETPDSLAGLGRVAVDITSSSPPAAFDRCHIVRARAAARTAHTGINNAAGNVPGGRPGSARRASSGGIGTACATGRPTGTGPTGAGPTGTGATATGATATSGATGTGPTGTGAAAAGTTAAAQPPPPPEPPPDPPPPCTKMSRADGDVMLGSLTNPIGASREEGHRGKVGPAWASDMNVGNTATCAERTARTARRADIIRS